ncbi:N-acetylneuraminate synthase [Bordetella genomosp. 12]|uniref:N-acetylneuraminate synthase n=1 Tax=Bordetella genomosp. 12 TaxID=463035 RepID=A0A261VVW3_9BORD|nr:N-acetylneuraminate synthase [Bordetella genomosp. 12]OZI77642.1 N-acetylneuraminate synthase [Bordetella genomosp. 12]
MSVVIIAEAGVNHNGDIELAKQLVREAARAGADYVKFQSFITEDVISPAAPKAQYQVRATGGDESQYDMVRKLELSKEDHVSLVKECDAHGIKFFSTAFDPRSFDMLVSLGVEMVKVPSGELTNKPFLKYMAKLGLPLILSTGMADLGDIEAALRVIEEAGTPRSRVTILHCTTEYPAPMADVNLRAMRTLKHAFGTPVGYSDHTEGIEVAIAAVALGAVVIEKHFTLSKDLPGPDHKASLEPVELSAMVRSIRNIELARGDGLKRPTDVELKNRIVARRSIVASRDIQSGEIFTADCLATKRPGNGISPMRWDEVIGTIAKRSFRADELIEL